MHNLHAVRTVLRCGSHVVMATQTNGSHVRVIRVRKTSGRIQGYALQTFRWVDIKSAEII